MKKTIMIKIIIILIFISMVGMCVPQSYSIATTPMEYANQMTGDTGADIDTSQLKTIIGRVIGAIQVLSGIFTVIIIAFTGFEYVLCQTPDMKEQLKKKMLPIVIALVLIFGSVSIAQFVIGAFE